MKNLLITIVDFVHNNFRHEYLIIFVVIALILMLIPKRKERRWGIGIIVGIVGLGLLYLLLMMMCLGNA